MFSLLAIPLSSLVLKTAEKNVLFTLPNLFSNFEFIELKTTPIECGLCSQEVDVLLQFLKQCENRIPAPIVVSNVQNKIIDDYVTDQLVFFGDRFVSKTEMCLYFIKKSYA